MPDYTPYPTRREPRLLLVAIEPSVTRCLVIDAWEVRATSLLPRNRRAARVALWRLFDRTHPSHVLVHQPRPRDRAPVLSLLRLYSLRKGLPFGALDHLEVRHLARVAPDLQELLEQYPELRHLVRGPRDPWVRIARVALGVLSTRSLPPRRYVPDLSLRAESSVGC